MKPGKMDLTIPRGVSWARRLTFIARPTGSTGSPVAYGSGEPPTTLGSEGSYYVDVTTLLAYGPKTAGEWGSGSAVTRLDASGWSPTAQYRRTAHDATAYDFSFDMTNAANGQITISLDGDTQTALFTGDGVWDLKRGDTNTVELAGSVSVPQTVTRSS